ncbi:uncharacterized protein LOC131174066 [Hevea brasiliensis]|uniref:uncharacterized protein LOC131174066 n=1 Tax=Hevea brasiliensis TaxID=3981 RepID=UPI0025E770DE|nr:uncharacterized protein LOC131174066 [Hevea brasiliensis]
MSPVTGGHRLAVVRDGSGELWRCNFYLKKKKKKFKRKTGGNPPISLLFLSFPPFFFFLSPVTGRRRPKQLPTGRRPSSDHQKRRQERKRREKTSAQLAAAFRPDSGFVRRPIEAIPVALESLFRELSFDTNFEANGGRMSEIWRREVSDFSSFFVRSTTIRPLDRRSEITYGLRKRRGTWWYDQIRQMSPVTGGRPPCAVVPAVAPVSYGDGSTSRGFLINFWNF